MEVDEATARAKGWVSEHGGKTYYFCNPACKASFEKAPASFLGKGKGEGAGSEGHGPAGR
jgi:YHS domain-containing protein